MSSKQKRIGMYNVFVDSLSGWVKAVRSLVQFQINRLIMSINTKAAAVFNDSDVAETMSIINGQYVVSSDKTPYNFLFLLAIMLSVLLRYTDSVTPNSSYLQKHYIDCSKMELGLNNPITRVNHW